MRDSVPIVTTVKFTVDDRMVIADPCYVDKDDGATSDEVISNRVLDRFDDWGVVLDDCAGEWTGEAEIVDNVATHGWGDRVSILRLTRDGTQYQEPYEQIGSAGVDSGQMYAAGVEHLPVDYDALLAQYYDGPRNPASVGENWVNHNCLASNGGIVSSTGYGDGCYPVYVTRDSSGRPTVVEVRFLEEPEEDEDYTCEECGRHEVDCVCED